MAEQYIKSPNQASTIYGLDGNTVPRKKSLFYVRFVRTANGAGLGNWQSNLGFVVKSVDRPSVKPQIEEVNQYNKRRQITTGFKIDPMRINFYDTVDGVAMRMWDEYSRYYFGDFNQADASMFAGDTTSATMWDNGSGFGYVPQPSNDPTLDLNSQFFFDVIEVYQVFGGYYTQFDLINPKISDFAPDELDYSVTDPASITVTITYEAILYRNGNNPQPLSQSDALSAAFGAQLNGNVIPVPGAPVRQNNYLSTPSGTATPQANPLATYLNTTTGFNNLSAIDSSVGSGPLSQFGGNYNFGAASSSLVGGGTGDAAYASLSNPALAGSLSGFGAVSSTTTNPSDPVADLLGVQSSQSVPSAVYDNTNDTLTGLSSVNGDPNNQYAASYISENLTPAAAASTMYSGGSAVNQTLNTDGLTLNSQTLGIVNAQRSSTSQLGVNLNTMPVTNVPYNQLSSYDNQYSASDVATMQATPIPYSDLK